MKVKFDHMVPEAPTIGTFWFKPDKPVEFVAGQFIELTLPHDKTDIRGVKRWFTLSSSPTDKMLSITTKFTEPGSTFKQALRKLKPGEEVTMAEPMGDFVLPKDPAIPLVFVAGGMGITPYHSIFKWLADTKETRSIKFLYAVRNEDDIIFQDTFRKANIHATIIVSEPSEFWGGEQGHLSGIHILKLTEAPSKALIYLAGPEPMIEKLQDELVESEFPKNQIVTDYFPGYEPV